MRERAVSLMYTLSIISLLNIVCVTLIGSMHGSKITVVFKYKSDYSPKAMHVTPVQSGFLVHIPRDGDFPAISVSRAVHVSLD